MSINHFSSDIPQTPWWTQHHPHPFIMENPSPKSLNSNPRSINYNPNWPTSHQIVTKTEQYQIQKQPMFEKPLTPSDVGKLNRLVIPKQYAEKYFPLGADSGEKGLLLSFEDESGKLWRFRYSYWSSSQSYVLTKGWSRFVKEKRLDAGDVVLFERHPADCDRLFIGWRRRITAAPVQDVAVEQPDGNCSGGSGSGSGSGWDRVFYNAHPYPSHPPPHSPLLTYQADCLHAGSIVPSQRNGNGNGKSKRSLRLFGVNMEYCQPDESESEPLASDGSSFSSDGPLPHYQYYSSNHLNHMDMNLAEDVNQMRYHQG